MGEKNPSRGHEKQGGTFPRASGCWGLWEHRQEGAVLPRQSGLKESEAEQVLKEELEITEQCLWSWDDRGEGGLDRDKAGSTGLSYVSCIV